MLVMEETILRLYDKEMKNILSYPSLVAPILPYCIDELKDMSILEIIESIEKVPNAEEKIQKLDGELFTLKRRVPLRANSIWLIFVKNLKESRIGRIKNTIEWYNGKKRRVEERRSLMNGVFVYIGEDAKNSEGLFSYLYALFQSADPKRREKEFEKYGIERREEVEEVDQVYWDILKQSVQIESERLGKEIGLKLGQEIGEQKAKETKIQLFIRMVKQFLEAGTMSFEQIFSIVTNGYSKEEKELVLEALSKQS